MTARDGNINDMHREVRGWLQRVFGDLTIPQYEINQRTVTVLYDLMLRSEERDRDRQLLIDDLNQKTEEYHAEASRLSAILQNVGLSPASLSQSGNVSLRTLSNVAQILDLKVASDTNYFLAMTDLSREQIKVEDCRHEENLLNQNLFKKTKSAMIKSDSLKRAMTSLEDQAKEQGPQLEEKTRQAGFYHSKTKEYRNQLEVLEENLTESEVDPSVYHQSLVKLSEHLETLNSKLAPLRAKLESYNDLPPNVSLAKVKIEEAKRELASLEAELSRNIDMMHM
ncbi:HAUS augmin-like complex subunit 1 [Diadema setosum]|uniref:HAUS augmin-like complex subunit 1 n=1 Tax=Diadema setosum TaxID=31175 RepID=UPI003B3AE389